MARSRSYDDMSDDRVSKKGGSTTRILLVVILLSVLICVGAVLVWLKILDLEQNTKTDAVAEKSEETPVSEPQTQEEPVLETTDETESEADNTPDLSIDSGISALSNSKSEAEPEPESVVAFTEDVPEAKEEPVVFEESVEMKKPAIAQNLSISQQTFAKDLIKYQEYEIQKDDSLMSIAESFGLSVQTIVAVNMIKSTKDLWIGKTLQIPDRDGTLYVVGEGDTLLSITQQMGLSISPKTLGDVNGILEDNLIPGQKLFIPYETPETTETISASSEPVFVLPAEGRVVGLFNTKVVNPLGDDSIQLDGILLQSEPGAKVLASESGTVVDKGFNENGTQFIKIMHQDGYTTFYDYLGSVYVETADNVEKGQVIGSYAEAMANYEQPIIFFRIEQGGVAFDPYSFL